MNQFVRVGVLFVLCVAATGCGKGGGVAVDGKVVKGGNQVTLAEGESINISLRADTVSGSATVAKDGTFQAKASDGSLLKPGKYKVGVIIYGAPAAGAKGPPSSPMPKDIGETWDISADNKSFTLDLDKYADKAPGKK